MKALNLVAVGAAVAAFSVAVPAQVSEPTAPVDPNPAHSFAPVHPVASPLHQRTPTASLDPSPAVSRVGVRPLMSGPVAPARPSTTEATLTHSVELRMVDICGDPSSRYALLFGIERCCPEPIPGLELGFVPICVIGTGVLDVFGHAYYAVDDQLTGIPSLLFQALVWTPASASLLPEQITEVTEVELRPFDTIPPDGTPPGPTSIAIQAPGVSGVVGMVCICGSPPQVGAHVELVVPSSGYVLHLDDVLHASRFTRVLMTLERPSDDEIVTERLEPMETIVPLGFWVGHVEVVIRDRQRQPPVADPTKPAPVSVK
jgi:hypothetical protein